MCLKQKFTLAPYLEIYSDPLFDLELLGATDRSGGCFMQFET